MKPIDYNDPNDMWRNNGYDPYKGMSGKERLKVGFYQGVVFFAMLMLGLALCAMFGSCTTTKYVETVKTDTLRENHMVHDSVWVWCHDSIVTKERSDTVLVEKWHWRDRWRERLKTDTVYIAKHDTVVVRPQADAGGTAALSWWQQTKMRVGALVIFLMGIAVVWAIYKVTRKILP